MPIPPPTTLHWNSTPYFNLYAELDPRFEGQTCWKSMCIKKDIEDPVKPPVPLHLSCPFTTSHPPSPQPHSGPLPDVLVARVAAYKLDTFEHVYNSSSYRLVVLVNFGFRRCFLRTHHNGHPNQEQEQEADDTDNHQQKGVMWSSFKLYGMVCNKRKSR